MKPRNSWRYWSAMDRTFSILRRARCKTRRLAERNPEHASPSVELHPHRARLLRKLVPAKNVEVIQADVRELKEGEYDRVLVDSPAPARARWHATRNQMAAET